MSFIGVLLAFLATCFFLGKADRHLPKDAGREYAHEGNLSAGKPRGAGIVFIVIFIISSLLFAKISLETAIYLILIFAAMMTGYLDDASKTPWGEYKKGLLDLIIAVVTAVTYLFYNGNTIALPLFSVSVNIPYVIFAILIVILVWTSINVTNCSDGVDGLSGTLSIITLATIYIVCHMLKTGGAATYLALLLSACILGYLWHNAHPSRLLMGDAGSRAIGLFIGIMILKSGSPLLYIPAAIMLILDGGLGLIKVALLRFCKIRILKNTRTPLHDHVRKNKGWSDTQTVFRFAIIQIAVSACLIYLLLMR